ncbi:Uncharacterised protein [uncultured archaeon]|nr:Uncharacterised protein [uncultured archaeon]
MKWMIVAKVSILLLLAMLPVAGEISEYQRGLEYGLRVGLFMGEYYGRGQYVDNYAGQFNTYLDQYNQFLYESFANNQTLLSRFTLSPIAVKTRASSTGVLKPDASGRIFGYPASSYYTWIGAVPGTKVENPGDALPGV